MYGFFDDDEDPQRELLQTLLEASSKCIEDGGGQRATALDLLNFAIGAAYLVFTEDELLKSMVHAFQREQRDKGRGGDRMAAIFKPEEPSGADADKDERRTVETTMEPAPTQATSEEPKPTVPEVAPLVSALYASEHGAVGGCLHIVLSDGNIGDGSVQFCVDLAIERGCQQCEHIGRLLLRMSKTQRIKLSKANLQP